MRYFITGGLGAIGSTIVRYFVEKGDEVTVFDINHKSTHLVKDILDKIKIVKGDISNLPNLITAIKSEKPNYVIHMAGVLDVLGKEHPIKNIKTNIIGTMNVFETCRLLNLKRVIYCSSRGVFLPKLQGKTPEFINEDFLTLPQKSGKLYDISKLYEEYLADTYNKKYGMECVGLRFSVTFGPGKKLEKQGYFAIISTMIENAINNIPTIIPRGGEQCNDYVYYKDIAQAIELTCKKRKLKHFIFNIGSGTILSLFDIANAIRIYFPQVKIKIGKGIDFLNTGGYGYIAFNINRAKKELGYKPRFSITKAIEDYIKILTKSGNK